MKVTALGVLALVHGVHLVGTDVLGDAAGLALGHLRGADGVQQAGLAVVDVTHDGDDRRAGDQVLVALVGQLGLEVDVELAEQVALLVLGRDDLDVVAELGAEHAERVLVERLRRGGHLTEVEQHRDQGRRVRTDAVGEVGQAEATTHPDDGLAVTAGNRDATERRSLHLLELLTLRALALAPADRTDHHRGRTHPGCRRDHRGRDRRHRDGRRNRRHRHRGATAATGTAGETAAATATGGTTTGGPTGATATGCAATGRTGTADSRARAGRHHAGVGSGTARTGGAAGTRGGPGPTLRARHALLGREGVVARPGSARSRHALARRERVVPGRGAPGRPLPPSARAAGAAGAGLGVPGRWVRPDPVERTDARPGWPAPPQPLPAQMRRAPARPQERTGAGAGAAGVGAAGAGGCRRCGRCRGCGGCCRGLGRRGRRRCLGCSGGAGPRGSAVFFAAAFLAGAFASAAGICSRRRRTTGGSTVDDADRTNSPISLSLVMMTLLSTPSSFASS